jgi:hypothetical protein
MRLFEGDNWIRERKSHYWRGRRFVTACWRLVRVAFIKPGKFYFSAVSDPLSWGDPLTPQPPEIPCHDGLNGDEFSRTGLEPHKPPVT